MCDVDFWRIFLWAVQVDWSRVFVEMASAFIGFFGVLVGGLISFGIQWYFQKQNDDKELRSGLRALQFHIIDSINDIGRINRHLDRNIPQDFEGEIWTVFQPLANMHEGVIELEKRLLAPLCDGKSDEFLNDLLNFISYRNALVSLLKTYNHKRAEINEITAPFAQVERGRMQANLAINAREHPEVIMKINEIEVLARDVVAFAREGVPLMRGMIDGFPLVVRRIGGSQFVVRFEIDEPQVLQA